MCWITARIDAVELNLQMIDLVGREFGEFTGRIYRRPEVSLHVAEARSFVEGSRRRWDLIQLALLDSYAASAAGVQALSESPIYTIEALQAYLEHLNPGGFVAVTHWLGNPPRDTVKLFATAIAALEANVWTSPGETDAGEWLVLLHGWNTATLLVKNGHFTRDEIAALRSFAAERQFDVAWYPGMRGDEANRYNRLAKPTLYDAAVALLSPGRSTFLADYRFTTSGRRQTTGHSSSASSSGVSCPNWRRCAGRAGSCFSILGTWSSFWRCYRRSSQAPS
jgi:hypothetical protein